MISKAMDPAAWRETIGILDEQGVFDAPVEPEEAYDNRFAGQGEVKGSG